MAEKLNWFKFDPANWMMGRISRQPEKVQLAYLRLCCIYWNKRCQMTIEDATLEIMEEYEVLVKYKFVKTEKKSIRISWLDEQLKDIDAKSVKAADAAEARWSKRNANALQSDANALQSDANALQLQEDALQKDAEEKRKEQNRKDEEDKKKALDLLKKKKYTDEFEIFWNAYNKKGSKSPAFTNWQELTSDEQKAAVRFIPEYFASKPDTQFRKDAERYLKNKTFEDAIALPPTQTAVKVIGGKQTQPTELLNLLDQQVKNQQDDKGLNRISQG